MSTITQGAGVQEFIQNPEIYYLHIEDDSKTGTKQICAERRGIVTWIKAHIFSSSYKLHQIADTVRSSDNLADLSPEFIASLNQRIKKYNSLHTDQIEELPQRATASSTKGVAKKAIITDQIEELPQRATAGSTKGVAKKAITTETAPPSKPTTAKSETLVKHFWEAINRGLAGNCGAAVNDEDKELFTFFQLIIANPGEDRVKAKSIVNFYEEFLEKKGEKLPRHSKLKLEKEILGQLGMRSIIQPTTRHISKDYDLRTLETVGDGSCGLHALLCDDYRYGIPTGEGEERKCKAKEARHDFCDWLRKLGNVENWPDSIRNQFENSLVDFAAEQENDFVRRNRALIEEYVTPPKNASKNELKTRLVEAYLKCLEDTTAYLTQPELFQMAVFFDKNVALYQPGWGYDCNKFSVQLQDRRGNRPYIHPTMPNEQVQAKLNDQVSEGYHICIYYNGISKHFERALLVSKREE